MNEKARLGQAPVRPCGPRLNSQSDRILRPRLTPGRDRPGPSGRSVTIRAVRIKPPSSLLLALLAIVVAADAADTEVAGIGMREI